MKELTLREIQLSELDMLIEFDGICKEKGLKYTLVGGTLLGAVRHKGFIPWDDDIDVGMPRPDYEKFKDLIKNKEICLPQNLTVTCDSGKTAQYPFLKIVNNKISVKEEHYREVSGLWIDIFPIDGLPDDRKKIAKIYKKTKSLSRIIYFGNLKKFDKYYGLKKLAVKLYHIYCKCYGLNRAVKNINKLSTRYDFNTENLCGVVAWGAYGVGEAYEKSGFEEMVNVEFEGHELPAIGCWEKYLHGIYGDYMTLPPEEKRVTHSFAAFTE